MELLKINQLPFGRKRSSTTFNLVQKVVSKYWYLFLLFIIISLGVAFWININTVPLYLVRTSLLVKEVKNISNNPQNLLYGEADELKSARSNVPEEIALLESYHFIRRAIDSMQMQISYFAEGRFHLTELYKHSPFKVSFPDPGSISKLYGANLRMAFTDFNHVRVEQLSDNKHLEGKIYDLNRNININGCSLIISPTGYFNPTRDIGSTFQFNIYNPEVLTWEFRNNLNIQANGLDGDIIRIYLTTTVPEKGIDFLNEFTRQYLNYKYEEKIRAVSQSMDFIDKQLGLIGISLGNTESNLESFKSNNNFSDASKMTDRSLAELTGIEKNSASLIFNEKYYTDLLNALKENKSDGALTSPTSVGINDVATAALIQNLTNLQMEKQGYISSGITMNPLVKDVDNKIITVKEAIRANAVLILQSLHTQMSIYNNQQGKHQTIISNLPKAERKYVDINRQNNLNEQIYLFLSQKKLEAGIMKSATTVENKVIENALLDSNVPLKPKKKNNYALAILLGLLLPSGIIWTKKLFSRKFSEEDDLHNLISVPVIGTIFLNTQEKTPVITSESRTITSESIRILRSHLTSMDNDTPKFFLITSMDSGEGKSFCSYNIATSFALLKKKTILVNMDLRTTNKIYNHLENCLGIGAYLDDLVSIQDIIVSTEQPYMDYIPAGDSAKYYSELFRDNKISELFNSLKRIYEYIIIDSSPLGKLAEPLIVSRYTSFNLVIVRPNYTLREHLLELEQMIIDARIKNVGIVLNGKKIEKKDKSRYYNQPPKSKARSRKVNLT